MKATDKQRRIRLLANKYTIYCAGTMSPHYDLHPQPSSTHETCNAEWTSVSPHMVGQPILRSDLMHLEFRRP